MIACEVVRRHVDAVVDGEVDADTQIEFEQHMASCGPCRVHLAFARSFKSQVKEACETPDAPVDLASRIRAALDVEDGRRAGADEATPIGSAPLGLGVEEAPAPAAASRASQATRNDSTWKILPFKARYAVPAAAAAVAVAWVASQGGNPTGVQEGLTVEAASTAGTNIFDDVVRRHSSEHPAEVTGPPTQVASWFRGKLEFSVQPVDFEGPDVRLVGARISNVSNREAAAFFYTVRGQRVTVMVFEPPPAMDRLARHVKVQGRGLYYGQARGHTVPMLQHHGLTYAFAGDVDSRTLMQLAARARVHER